MAKILIIDPNELFRQALKDLLMNRFPSVEVEVAVGGDEGLKKAKTLQPEIVFLEIHLPAESGLDICRKIKTDCPEAVIALLTTYDLPEYLTTAKQYGIEHLIPKEKRAGKDIVALVQAVLSDSLKSSV